MQFAPISSPSDARIETLLRIYADSFPPEERRPVPEWLRLVEGEERFHVWAIYAAGAPEVMPSGLLTWWRLDGFDYVEHFAVDAPERGSGLGSAALDAFIHSRGGRPVVLEVELPLTDTARRRIAFYERHGFEPANDLDYVQPSYASGLPPVPMLLLRNGELIDMAAAADSIYSSVYGANIIAGKIVKRV